MLNRGVTKAMDTLSQWLSALENVLGTVTAITLPVPEE